MRKIAFTIASFIALLQISCGNMDTSNNGVDSISATASNNPLFKESVLPYQTVPFDKLKDNHFKPALLEGMKQQMTEIGSIANNTEPATFENTMVAMEKSGRLLSRASSAFYALTSANTNDKLKAVQQEMAPRMAQHRDAIFLNEKLFARVDTIYKQLSKLELDDESKKLVEYYYNEFKMAGADLSPEKKTELKALNEEEATLTTKFRNQLLDAGKNGAVVIEDVKQLDGLSQAELDAAQESAKGRDLSGKWLLSLQNTIQQPALQSLKNRETRQKLFEASLRRTEKSDSNDTRKTLTRIAKIRADKAKLMGYKNYAEWKLQDQMAKSPQAVQQFLSKLVTPAVNKAKGELKDIQAMINKQQDTFTAQAWDWNYYAEQVRKEKFDLDESLIKPYFEINTVLEKGIFYTATKLFGITFKERTDIPVYHEDVRVFEVFDKDSSELALFYFDPYKRDNKSGGAWMGNFVEQSKLLGTKPVIYNVCNYTKPAEGQPALISFDDVITMFHEFGHATHGLFANQTYPSLSGTNVARDFVELPSQINEHWALYPEVLKNYAVHYQTGEPMPQDLIDKITKAATFNQGYMLTEFLAAAQLDMQWHSLSADLPEQDANQFEREALERTGLYLQQVPPRYTSSVFQHVFGGGYAAGYYAYSWAEMLDNDAFAWFMENGGLKPENGQRFRDMILSIGNTQDYNKAFKAFRGKDPSIQPMLKKRGIN